MGNAKVKGKKIRNNSSKDEIKEDSTIVEDSLVSDNEDVSDKEIEVEDNMSFALMIFILAMCFIVVTVVGYLLYRLAINNSNALFIYDFFKIKM